MGVVVAVFCACVFSFIMCVGLCKQMRSDSQTRLKLHTHKMLITSVVTATRNAPGCRLSITLIEVTRYYSTAFLAKASASSFSLRSHFQNRILIPLSSNKLS